MATIAINIIDRDGLDLDAVDAAASGGGDVFANDGKTFLYVNNAGASAVNITVPLANDPNADEPLAATAAVVYNVGIGLKEVFGPFPTAKFGTSISITYDQVTSTTIAALTLAAS